MDKVRQWSLLTAIGVLAVFVAGWFLLVSPQRSHAAALRTQALSQKQANDTLRMQVAGLRAQQKDLPKQQARLAQIATKIPDNPALPSLIRALSDAADGAGVDLGSLAPAQPTMVAAAASGQAVTAGAATTAATGASPLAQIPVTLMVSGSYFNVEQFLASLESLKRAMKVTGFSLAQGATSSAATAPTAGGTSSSSTVPGGLTASINAVVYMTPPVAAATTTALKPAAPAAATK